MKKIIDWIKSNLAIVISSLVAAVAIICLVLGMMDNKVLEVLQADTPLVNNLTSLRPINESMIIAALAEQEKQQRQLQDILTKLKTSTTYKPLIDTVFPTMTEINKLRAPHDFRKAYREKQLSFLSLLNAKDRVSTSRTDGLAPGFRPRRADNEDFGRTPIRREDGGRGPLARGESGEHRPPLSSTGRLQASRDDMIHAQGISLYTNISNLDSRNPAVKEVTEGTGPLTIEQMWMAQVSLWIQEDLVEALQRTNAEAADKLSMDNRWVGYLPVKHLKDFSMEGSYRTSAADSGISRGGGRVQEVFIGPRPSSVDTIRFNLTLVVEANALLQVIEAISQQGFYTLLHPSSITAVPATTALSGYIYGSAPAVEIEMLWEVCLLRSAYESKMPQSIKDMLDSGTTGMEGRESFGGFAGPR